MPAFPGMPAMPAFPNLSAGGGGPSSARTGNTTGGGGFDGSNWAVNFGGQNGVGTPVPGPVSVGYTTGPFGLPRIVNGQSSVAAVPNTGGIVLSPTLLLIGAVVLFALRRRG